MRVLFLTNIPSPYRVDFFNELGKKCDLTVLFEAQIAKSRNTKWKSGDAKCFNAVYLKGFRVGDAEAFCPKVISYLSKEKYDIIVVGMYSTPTAMLAIEYMRLKKIPFFISSDGGIKKDDKGIRHWVKQHFIQAADAWLSTGRLTDEYLTYYGAYQEKIFRYPFTSVKESEILNNPLTSSEKKVYKELLGVKEKVLVLSVGQFTYRKGYDLLLQAFKDIDKNIGLYIIGGIPTEEYLLLKNELDLDNVYFLDFMVKSELANYYKAADVFVLPTREDIWGLVINEAFSFGLPVITTDKCVAGCEMITDQDLGEILPMDEFVHLFPEKLIEYKNKNVHKILERSKKYSIEEMAKMHYSIFEEYMKSDGNKEE